MINRKQSNPFTTFSVLIFLVIQLQVIAKTPTDLTKTSLIPKPVSITATGGFFTFKETTGIYVQGESNDLKLIGQDLSNMLKPATGFGFAVKTTAKVPRKGNIYLKIDGSDPKLGKEGYELTINKKLLILTANGTEGLYHGIQTIRQLLPSAIDLPSKQIGPWQIATGTITDFPVYSYRGMMLDVSRHFFGVDDVKKIIDFLAYYKMNVLHLHLSDDQGWRIEIKSWPNLAIHGGSTQVGGGKGGYYTQQQYSQIVQYAKEHYIMIVPEIDMPGHTNGALSSYPELNCNDKATDLYTGTRVGFSSLCTNKEITYKFIDDVIGELTAMTPGPYIHIGGDESKATKEEDYIQFINKVQEIVTSHGKQVMGWDDIAIANLKANVVAQHWATLKNAKMAISKGAKIIMSPARKAYIDMQYDKKTPYGLHWAGYLEVDSAYCWDPAKIVPGIGSENVLGIESPLWTETITNIDQIEYMVFPRLPGYAEIGWTPSSSRNWDEYKVRLGKQGERFKAMNINYYPSVLVPWEGNKKF
jgi:hexosaminidase